MIERNMLDLILCFRDDVYDVLAVTDWGQRLSFYQLSGKQVNYMNYYCFSALIYRLLSSD